MRRSPADVYHPLVSVLVQFENTPKALANFSPWLERSDNPGKHEIILSILKGLISHRPNTFSVGLAFLILVPGLSLALQPRAEISQRLRRFDSMFKLNQYLGIGLSEPKVKGQVDINLEVVLLGVPM